MLNVSNNIDALLSRAQQAYAAGDLMQARALVVQGLEQQPEHPRAWHLLGAIFLDAGRPDAAAEYFQRSVACDPARASAHSDLGLALREAGQFEKAIRHYRLALTLQPELTIAREQLDELLAARGIEGVASLQPDPQLIAELNAIAGRISAAHFSQAMALYEASLSLDPNQPATLAQMGSLYMLKGQEQSAVAVLRRAVELGDRSAQTSHQLAKALLKRRWFAEALDAVRSAAQADPADPDIQWTMTQVLADIQTRDAMIAHLREQLAANPESEDIKFKLATIADRVDLATIPVARVSKMFDEYAGYFETHLLQRLKYRGHEQIFGAVKSAAPGRMFDILDLGCGTGLCGATFKPVARSLNGVDVAPAMVARAQARGIYDAVEHLELVSALVREADRYDLILAADVFEYVGDLSATFAAAAQALRSGGLFAFSVEKADVPGFFYHRQTSSFAHSLAYIQELARCNCLAQLSAQECIMRMEAGVPLVAWIIVLQKGSPGP